MKESRFWTQHKQSHLPVLPPVSLRVKRSQVCSNMMIRASGRGGVGSLCVYLLHQISSLRHSSTQLHRRQRRLGLHTASLLQVVRLWWKINFCNKQLGRKYFHPQRPNSLKDYRRRRNQFLYLLQVTMWLQNTDSCPDTRVIQHTLSAWHLRSCTVQWSRPWTVHWGWRSAGPPHSSGQPSAGNPPPAEPRPASLPPPGSGPAAWTPASPPLPILHGHTHRGNISIYTHMKQKKNTENILYHCRYRQMHHDILIDIASPQEHKKINFHLKRRTNWSGSGSPEKQLL